MRAIVNEDTRTYDLHIESGYRTIGTLAAAYNGLLEYDDEQTDKIVPGLAEKWETAADGKAFTFDLRKGVNWHDGKPFIAADAKLSLERLMKLSPNLMEPLAAIQKVEAVSDNVLTVTLKQPSPVFTRVLADSWAAIAPKHIVEAQGDMKRTVVGTGPFKFANHMVGSSMQLVRNPDYFVKGKPYLDGLTFYPIGDVATAMAAFRTRRVDLAGILTLTTTGFVTLAEQEPKATVGRYPESGWWNFHMPVGKSPWDDNRVRRAVHLAIDRQAFVKIIERGYGSVASNIPPMMGGPTLEELKDQPGFRQPKDADRAEAKKLLQEAGYGNGFGTKMLHRSGEPFRAAAVLLQDQLKSIGIAAELIQRTGPEMYDYAYRGDFHSFMIRAAWKVPDPDGLLPTNYRSGSMRNYSGLIDTEIDQLIDKQSVTTDEAKRKEMLRDIDRRLTEHARSLTTHWFDYMIAWWGDTVNYVLPLTFTSNVRYTSTWRSE